jgi:hypothetical protein
MCCGGRHENIYEYGDIMQYLITYLLHRVQVCKMYICESEPIFHFMQSSLTFPWTNKHGIIRLTWV